MSENNKEKTEESLQNRHINITLTDKRYCLSRKFICLPQNVTVENRRESQKWCWMAVQILQTDAAHELIDYIDKNNLW